MRDSVREKREGEIHIYHISCDFCNNQFLHKESKCFKCPRSDWIGQPAEVNKDIRTDGHTGKGNPLKPLRALKICTLNYSVPSV